VNEKIVKIGIRASKIMTILVRFHKIK
jgi:hypothetical protein